MVTNQLTQPLVLLFAGQGNPVIGMGADLWDLNKTTKHIWDCASDISGMDIRRLCQKGPMNRLIQTTVQQVAVTAINATLYSLCAEKMRDTNIVGSCGHSVGEYSALYAAGALTLETLFKLIHVRANIMNDISKEHKGAMLAVKGADYQTLSNLISHSGLPLDISCDNSQRQQVIGGVASDLSDFSRALIESGYEAIKLGVSGAWHTHLMTNGVQQMRDFLAGIPYSSLYNKPLWVRLIILLIIQSVWIVATSIILSLTGWTVYFEIFFVLCLLPSMGYFYLHVYWLWHNDFMMACDMYLRCDGIDKKNRLW